MSDFFKQAKQTMCCSYYLGALTSGCTHSRRQGGLPAVVIFPRWSFQMCSQLSLQYCRCPSTFVYMSCLYSFTGVFIDYTIIGNVLVLQWSCRLCPPHVCDRHARCMVGIVPDNTNLVTYYCVRKQTLILKQLDIAGSYFILGKLSSVGSNDDSNKYLLQSP
jgi:hypothetical protein